MGKTEQQKTKKFLLQELNHSLSKIPDAPGIRSLSEGKEYVCSVCDLTVKACDAYPQAMCNHMLQDGTVIQFFEQQLQSMKNIQTRHCLSCGADIPLRRLKKHPLTELCSDCEKKGRRIRTSPSRSKRSPKT